MSVAQKCKINGCLGKGNLSKATGKRHFVKGYCYMHYRRHYRGKSLTAPTARTPRPAIIEGNIAKIPLGINAKDGYAIVDKEFAYLADEHKFSITDTGYAIHSNGFGRPNTYLHHIIVGKPSKNSVVDHINMDKLDNRKSNLRITNKSVNAINSGKRINKSGYRGVSPRNGRWVVQICKNGNHIYGGIFDSKIEAARAYNKLALKYHGEFASLNKV